MTNVEELLDKLESCVISCNNIVTYKWISQEWGIHVNTAKQLLYKYTNNGKSKEAVNLEVIYFVSGILDDGEGSSTYQVSLVREKDLKKTKTKYKTILSEHVYSIQKSSLKDLHDLYIVDKANGEKVIQGKCGQAAIRCDAAVPRSIEAYENWRAITVPVKSEPVFENAQSGSVFNGSSSKEDTSKREEVKEEVAVNGKIKKDERKGIAGLFAAQTVKNTAKKSDSESPDVNKELPKTIVQKPKNQKNGIASMFAKQAEKPPAKKPKKEERKKKLEPITRKVDEKEEEEDPFASEDEEDVKREMIIEDERSKSPVEVLKKGKTHNNEKDKKKKKKRVNGAPDEESPLPSKKRRRIKMMDSSGESSDEEMEVGESESPIPESTKNAVVSDDDDIIPATPSESLEQGEKRRIRKRILQDNTFMDEQGFIVTKKEYIFVSCSEDSNDNDMEAKSKDLSPKTNTNGTPSSNDVIKKKNEPVNTNKEATSPKEKEMGKKGRKGKEDDKSKKAGKKFSPQNVRQGVLTSFFKRAS